MVSYDDGDTIDFDRDVIGVDAENRSFDMYKSSGCMCGYGNSIELKGSGPRPNRTTLVSVYSFQDTAGDGPRPRVGVVRWTLPTPVKADDDILAANPAPSVLAPAGGTDSCRAEGVLHAACLLQRNQTAEAPTPNETAAALQRALDSGDDVQVSPRPGAQPAWLVGRGVTFRRSHQRVTFAPGTLVYAANDSFHGRSDCLVTIGRFAGMDMTPALTNLSIVGWGAVWKMRRKDYAKTGSGKSNGWCEWSRRAFAVSRRFLNELCTTDSVSESRAGLNIAGAAAVSIEGLTIACGPSDSPSFLGCSSLGLALLSPQSDGRRRHLHRTMQRLSCWLSRKSEQTAAAQNTAWNVSLTHVTIDGGYRNGISVIAVDGLQVQHTIVRNTRGTDPEAVSRNR